MLQIVYLVVAALVILTLLRILRAGRIREKYAALWIVVGIAIVLLAAWPGLLVRAAALLGVQVAANLLFFLTLLLLLGVALHLSLEVSKLEDESRALAEEVALLHARLDGDPALADRGSPEAPEPTCGDPGI